MRVSKTTIVRTILLLLVITNLILERCGIDVIKTDESLVYAAVEYIIEIAIILAGFWYNNSYSEKALKAQKYLEELRNSE